MSETPYIRLGKKNVHHKKHARRIENANIRICPDQLSTEKATRRMISSYCHGLSAQLEGLDRLAQREDFTPVKSRPA